MFDLVGWGDGPMGEIVSCRSLRACARARGLVALVILRLKWRTVPFPLPLAPADLSFSLYEITCFLFLEINEMKNHLLPARSTLKLSQASMYSKI